MPQTLAQYPAVPRPLGTRLPQRAGLPARPPASRRGQRTARLAALLPIFLAACATDGGGPAGDSRSSLREPRPDTPRNGAVSAPPPGQPDWAAVYESPKGTGYADQRVVFIDRRSVRARKLDALEVYLGTTREVSNLGRAKIQELAVICEGTPKAPASSLRGEGSEDSEGRVRLVANRAPMALDQFSTQRLRLDPKNPSTFVVRALCLIGMELPDRKNAPSVAAEQAPQGGTTPVQEGSGKTAPDLTPVRRTP